MKFSTKNILKIILKYSNELYTFENRKLLFDELNNTFFYDNIAEFIDKSEDYSRFKYISSNELRMMIKYKNNQYNILAFKTDVLPKIIRIRKLLKISENE